MASQPVEKPSLATPALASVRDAVRRLPGSKIREIADLGMGEDGVIALWFGESDTPTPGFIRDAAAQALAEGDTFYQPNLGIEPLRGALADYMSRLYGVAVGAQSITVTVSGMNAVMLSMQAILDAGDGLVATEPSWPNLPATAEILGARVHRVPLDAGPQGWRLDLDRLIDACTPGTRAILLNSPNNPTGWMMSSDEQRAVLDFARKRGIWIVSDEVYARVVYDRDVAPSFVSIAAEEDLLIVVNSFSKSWAMTGWRLGWITAPPSLVPVFEKLMEYNIASPAGFIQRAGLVAVRHGEDFVRQSVDGFRRGRDVVFAGLGQLPRVTLARPDAAFYAFFAVDGLDDGVALARRILAETGVGLAPGEAFGDSGRGYMRLCFATSGARLEEAMGRLQPLLR